MSTLARRRVTAVLGPTNTGKTYLAIERMLGYRSGMIGFPLRLLARENYDRALKLKGARQVALVTGEEKIVPPGARYFFCTVESMPVDRLVEFLAIDEIQLCADPERGHVFTERLLHARGLEETMFLGAETMRPIIRALVPEAEYISRPRFSTISYSGPKKITRLPKRSAVVAFSAASVYALAELVRRQRGGTAVVLGALSPRTRNAQVAMFEAGEVDYLVATDAIGMGLNLDLDHVAFSRLSKFDGFGPRPLRHAEVAQIAGRAGRHMNDGTFGTTDGLAGMDEELVSAVETHSFEALKAVYWRNRQLDFRSLEGLLRSLERRPSEPALIRVRDAEDHQALAILARDQEIAAKASHPEGVALLWEVCQVPDFQKILTDQHARLLARLYGFLCSPEGRLPADWVAKQIDRVDRTEGDIDALIGRISQIRTWTYIAHRADWLADHDHWQERTRAIEDKLSDALHDRLTQRFVDKRTATLMSRLRDGDELLAAVRNDGEVLVEGEYVGTLRGFRFHPDVAVGADDAKALLTAARRALAGEIPARVKQLCGEADEAFDLTDRGALTWRGGKVARLRAGANPLTPDIEVLASDFLDGRQREQIRERLSRWLTQHLKRRLRPLLRLQHKTLKGPARGLAYQLVETLGTQPRAALSTQLRGLDKEDRKILGGLGIRLGRSSIFVTALIRPKPARLRGLLWAIHHGVAATEVAVPDKLTLPLDRLPSALAKADYAHAVGYRLVTPRKGGALLVRADALERLTIEAGKRSRKGPLRADASLCQIAACSGEELGVILTALGYRQSRDDSGVIFLSRPGKARKTTKTGAHKSRVGTGKAATAAHDAASAKTEAGPSARSGPAKSPAGPAKPPGPLREGRPGRKRRKRSSIAKDQPTTAPGIDNAAQDQPQTRKSKAAGPSRRRKAASDSPFAKLRELKIAT